MTTDPNTPKPQLNLEMCAKAWRIVLPSIVAAANEDITNKLAGCLVVLAPGGKNLVPPHMVTPLFRAHVTENADPKYEKFATEKAYLCERTGLTSSEIQQKYPLAYAWGDIKWGGGVPLLPIPGFGAVGFSGVEPVFDEMFAEMFRAALYGLSRHEMTRPGGVMGAPGAFIGDPA